MSAIDAARDLLPAWALWAPLLYVPGLFLLSFAAATAGTALTLGPLRRAGETPWPERARLAHPPRAVAGNAAVLGLLAGAFAGLFAPFPLCPVPPGVLTLLLALAGYAGAALVAFRVEREVRRGDFPLREWLRGLALVWLLLNGWLAVLLVLAAFMPATFTPRAGLLLAGGAVVLAFFALGGGLHLARLFGLARPASERARAVVERASRAMGVSVRAAHEVDYPAANAFALIFLQRLAFTPRLLAAFDDEELSAVTAHELGHLTESRLMVLARCAPMAFVLLLAASRPIANDFGEAYLLGVAAAWLVVVLLVGWLSRQLERRADRIARQAPGEEGAYARALAAIHEVNLSPVVAAGKGGSHPHLYDRLVAAGAPPDYPRPPRPSALRMRLGVAAVVMTWVVVLVGTLAGRWPFSRAERTEGAIVRSLALGGLTAIDLSDLARRRWAERNYADAATLYAAAGAIDPRSPDYPALQAMALAQAGRCEEAGLALKEAERRLAASRRRRHEGLVDAAREAVEDCRQRFDR